MHSSSPTLQHAVICFPVPPPEGLPESCGLCSLITFPDGHLAAAVEACLQRTTAQRQRCHTDWWDGFISIHFARGSIEVSGTAFVIRWQKSNETFVSSLSSVTLTCAYWIFLGEKSSHSLFFDFAGGGVCHLPCVCLRLAAMPQVDEGLADAQQHHRDPGAQAAAVTGHLQQVALHLHLAPYTVQTPVIWGGRQGEKWRRWTHE